MFEKKKIHKITIRFTQSEREYIDNLLMKITLKVYYIFVI